MVSGIVLVLIVIVAGLMMYIDSRKIEASSDKTAKGTATPPGQRMGMPNTPPPSPPLEAQASSTATRTGGKEGFQTPKVSMNALPTTPPATTLDSRPSAEKVGKVERVNHSADDGVRRIVVNNYGKVGQLNIGCCYCNGTNVATHTTQVQWPLDFRATKIGDILIDNDPTSLVGHRYEAYVEEMPSGASWAFRYPHHGWGVIGKTSHSRVKMALNSGTDVDPHWVDIKEFSEGQRYESLGIRNEGDPLGVVFTATKDK